MALTPTSSALNPNPLGTPNAISLSANDDGAGAVFAAMVFFGASPVFPAGDIIIVPPMGPLRRFLEEMLRRLIAGGTVTFADLMNQISLQDFCQTANPLRAGGVLAFDTTPGAEFLQLGMAVPPFGGGSGWLLRIAKIHSVVR